MLLHRICYIHLRLLGCRRGRSIVRCYILTTWNAPPWAHLIRPSSRWDGFGALSLFLFVPEFSQTQQFSAQPNSGGVVAYQFFLIFGYANFLMLFSLNSKAVTLQRFACTAYHPTTSVHPACKNHLPSNTSTHYPSSPV
jgi:hypothetical protein